MLTTRCFVTRIKQDAVRIQGAEANNKDLRALCEETKALGQTLEQLAKLIQAGLDKFPPGSTERQMQEQLLKASKLPERLLRLQRFVVPHLLWQWRDLPYGVTTYAYCYRIL